MKYLYGFQVYEIKEAGSIDAGDLFGITNNNKMIVMR